MRLKTKLRKLLLPVWEPCIAGLLSSLYFFTYHFLPPCFFLSVRNRLTANWIKAAVSFDWFHIFPLFFMLRGNRVDLLEAIRVKKKQSEKEKKTVRVYSQLQCKSKKLLWKRLGSYSRGQSNKTWRKSWLVDSREIRFVSCIGEHLFSLSLCRSCYCVRQCRMAVVTCHFSVCL